MAYNIKGRSPVQEKQKSGKQSKHVQFRSDGLEGMRHSFDENEPTQMTQSKQRKEASVRFKELSAYHPYWEAVEKPCHDYDPRDDPFFFISKEELERQDTKYVQEWRKANNRSRWMESENPMQLLIEFAFGPMYPSFVESMATSFSANYLAASLERRKLRNCTKPTRIT